MESKPYIEREDIQALLDACRVKFSVDLVFVGELMPEEDLIEFTYVSVSDEQYSILGHKCSVKGEKGDEPLLIDDEGISTRGRKSVFGDGADRMIFYGLISEKQYNGCVGMIDYHRKRNWTKEERAALQKMGRSLKYVLYEELANRTNRVAETRIDKQSLALQAFFETTDCGMMRHSLDGKKVFSINKAALKILGYETKEELEKAGFNADFVQRCID
jgi:PAS domain-containing protein